MSKKKSAEDGLLEVDKAEISRRIARATTDSYPLIKKLAADKITNEKHLHFQQCSAIGTEWSEALSRLELFSNEEYYSRLTDFIHLLDYDSRTQNPYNNEDITKQLINDYGVAERLRFEDYWQFDKCAGEILLSYGRQEVMAQYPDVYRHIALIIISGGPQRYPLIFDRDYRVIDGLQRLKALRFLQNFGFHAIRLNYVHSEDRLNSNKTKVTP